MRTALFAVALAVAGCSFTDGEPGPPLTFRALATAQVFSPAEPVQTAHTAAQAEALAAALDLTVPLDADFATETVVAVSTFGGCPATNYAVAVVDVRRDANGATVTAEVSRVGDVGGGAVTFPVAVVAVEGLASALALRLVGDAQACDLSID